MQYGAGIKHAFLTGFLFGAALFGATLFWLSNLFGAAAISLIAIAALFPGIFCGLLVWLRARTPRIPIWLLVALLWTGIEYYRSEPFILSFGWMGLGYGQIGSPIAARLASVVGCYGVTFAIVAAATATWSRPRPAIVSIALLAWLLFIYIPLPATRPDRPLRVRLIQAMSGDEDEFRARSLAGAGPKPEVIVWPEYSLIDDPIRNITLHKDLTHIARQTGAILILGAEDQFDAAKRDGYYNTAFVFAPDGRLLGKHAKNHLVHFFTDGKPGQQAAAIRTPFGRLGVAICFDMDYPDVARRMADDGAEVFLIPNMDPAEWGPVQRAQHRLAFRMRAAECGRWLARADVAGGTSVANPDGHEVARVNSGEPATLDALVGRRSGKTIFIRGGWLFGPACFWITVTLCAWAAAQALRDRTAARLPRRTKS